MPHPMRMKRKRLTAEQIAAFNTTPVEIVPAPPDGKWLLVHWAELEWRAGREPFTTPGTAVWDLQYVGRNENIVEGNFVGGLTRVLTVLGPVNLTLTATPIQQSALESVAVEAFSSAALDLPGGSVTVYVWYTVHDV